MTKVWCGAVLLGLLVATGPVGAKTAAAKPAARAGLPAIARDPYLGMIAIDAATGQTLVEDNPDATVYPASVIKLMTLFVIEDRIQQGAVHLIDQIEANAEVSHMGGSRVYLKEHELTTVEDLLYALMVQSANDGALALALHAAGSQPAFVELMNQKAQALGMTHTHFFSCHGEPPTPPHKPDEVDVSTPRDLAILGRALITSHPEILKYTSTKRRTFRANPLLIMDNHNHLLGMPGVDGLKTGWFRAAGYSIVVTMERDGRRVIAVVAGSSGPLGKVRDKAARETLARAFAALPPQPPRTPTNVVVAAFATNAPPDPTTTTPTPPPLPTPPASHLRWYAVVGGVLGVLVVSAGAMAGLMAWKRRQDETMTVGGGSSSRRRPPLPPFQR